jgi:hypothetical protein
MQIARVRLDQNQFQALLGDSLDNTGPCRLNASLPAADIAATTVVPNARILMTDLIDGAKLTAAANLNRRLVESLVDRLHWTGVDPAEVREFYKVINEQDYVPALYLHAILRASGMARKNKNVLKLTKTGKLFLDQNQSGQLQVTLFQATFAKYNLAYLDRFMLPEYFGQQIGLTLYLISLFCTDWRPPEEILQTTTIPYEPDAPPIYPGLPASAFQARVLRYLLWFGLMERTPLIANDNLGRRWRYRKTPLFDRMLSFKV